MTNTTNKQQVRTGLVTRLSVMLTVVALCLAWLGAGGARIALADESADGMWEYTLNGDGEATITAYKGTETSVTIPPDVAEGTVTGEDGAHKVVAIGSASDGPGAFEGNTSIESVNVYGPIKVLGAETFSGCTSLRTVMLNDGDLATIGQSCFAGCEGLESVIFAADNPSASLKVSASAFKGCASLTSVILPSNLDALEDGAFSGCSSLWQIVFTSAPSNISGSALSGCDASLIAVPQGWSKSAAEIGDSSSPIFVYEGGERASSSNGTTKIVGLFETPETTSITVPSQIASYMVTGVGDEALAGLQYVESIGFDDNSSVASVGYAAFRGCSALRSLTLPGSVTSVGTWCFADCPSLTTDPLAQVGWLSGSEIPEGLYAGCSGISDVRIPEGVTALGSECYEGTSISSVNLSGSVDSIGPRAFAGCTSLGSVTLPDVNGEFAASGDAFADCDFGGLRLVVRTGSGSESWLLPLVENGTYPGDVLAYDPVDLADDSVELYAVGDDFTYGSQSRIPALEGRRWAHELVEGEDYSIDPDTGIASGDGILTITVIGGGPRFTGSRTVTVEVTPADLSGNVSMEDIDWCVWDGDPWTPVSTWTYTSPDGDVTVLSEGDYELFYANNVDAGEATITLEGRGNYTGSQDFHFNIAKRDLSEAAIADIPDQRYSGKAITPVPEVSLPDRNGEFFGLEEGENTYSLSYADNVEYGTATITITAHEGANVIGGAVTTFDITSMDVSDAEIADIPSQAYTGSDITPELVVTYEGETLKEGTDYTVSYADNVHAGEASVTIKGVEPNFQGTKTATFIIDRKEAKVIAKDSSKSFGDADPEFTATVEGTLGSDTVKYTLTREEGETVGSYTIVASGDSEQGDYYVTFEDATLTIEPADISKACKVEAIADQPYTGEEVRPQVKVILNGTGTEAIEGEDYNVSYADNVNMGTAKVTVEGAGSLSGKIETTFKIVAASLSEATVIAEDQAFDGKEHKPAVQVSLGEKVLAEGADFEVSGYADNVNAGQAKVTVTGKGNYSGTATGTFTITPKDAKVVAKDCSKSFGAADPEFTATVEGTLGSDTVSYKFTREEGETVGTYAIEVTGDAEQGNYVVSFEGATLTIEPADISKACKVEAIADQPYTGEEVRPKVKVVLNGTGTEAIEGEDYTVSYADNVEMGTAKVTVEGAGSLSGKIETTFKIVAASLSEATVTAETQTFDGKEHKPAVQVSLGEKALVEGTDFEVESYADNVNAGKAKATVKGKGKYSGTATGTFTIERKAVKVTAKDCSKSVGAADPEFSATVEGTVGSDTVSYKFTRDEGEAIGTYAIHVKGDAEQGNYAVTFVDGALSIVAASISDSCKVDAIPDQPFTGEEVKPKVKVTFNGTGKEAVEGEDYTVSYADNVKVGTAKVILEGQGSLSGKLEATFKIVAMDLSKAKVEAEKQPYTGKALKPTPQVTLGEIKLVEGTDFEVDTYADNVDAGKAKVTVKGKGNYSGTATGTFTIEPVELKVNTGSASKAYDGTPLKEGTVKLTGLVEGEKATAKTTGSLTEVGEAPNTYTITWDTAKEKNYKIVEELGKLTVTKSGMEITLKAGSASKTYDGTPLKSSRVSAEGLPKGLKVEAKTEGVQTAVGESKNVISKDYKILDEKGKDCTKSFDNVHLVDGTLTVTAASLRDSSRFTVEPIAQCVYDGKEQRPKPVVKDAKTSRALNEGSECEFVYASNTAVGTATVSVVGKGNYSGSIDVPFEIVGAVYAPETSDELSYTLGSGSTIEFSFTREGDTKGTFDHFKSVKVDGHTISVDSYEAKRGSMGQDSSVVIMLKSEYLETLAAGKHALKAVFDDGSADATFVVAEAPKPVVPETNGGFMGILAVVAVLVIGCLFGLGFLMKGRQD